MVYISGGQVIFSLLNFVYVSLSVKTENLSFICF